MSLSWLLSCRVSAFSSLIFSRAAAAAAPAAAAAVGPVAAGEAVGPAALSMVGEGCSLAAEGASSPDRDLYFE
eukprot:CAMPEP_0194581164 /NCGR_PEP_ID=MMETSP0292-20121207/14707_1 /TAXON_ID=39354 /ORGANISM="Heterosigma akashiwo, Strain CCMP2393" /LENGTH=72 /DNA_ID=CAMNT_0039434795 /DNA_START=276 /DNA_END=494 /DNA_ORIENTATION=+